MSAENKKRHTILIVDDAAMNRALLTDMLSDDYDIIEAENGIEAIAVLSDVNNDVSLVLLDIVMPEMDGFEVLAIMNNRGWIKEIPVIMVSSERASSAVERAYLLGVTDFIGRPFDTSVVRHRVNNTLMLYAKQRALTDMVMDQIHAREKSVNLMVGILSQVVEFRNGESGLHVLHVNTLTDMLLHQLVKMKYADLSFQDIRTITMASSLHDIGKIAIPDSVLNKPGRLTAEEFEIMKQHSAIGAEMLRNLPFGENEPLVKASYDICRWHHERWDGSGYPDGLKGDEIPLSAQVVSLADVYDALTSERVYKPAFTHERAMEMILGGECGVFNPALIECLEQIADRVHDELKLDSLSTHTMRETNRTAEEAMRPDLVGPSDRTLDLLEYERTKFDFYAMMSKEVQFEVTLDPPMMKIADWGEQKLGLPELIIDPANDEGLQQMFGAAKLAMVLEGLLATTPDAPIVEYDLRVAVEGQPRWFHLYARALWSESEGSEPRFSGIIGKLVDIHESVLRLTELEKRATHDSLTGLTTHDFARQLVSERLAHSAKTGSNETFVMMMMDADNFKYYNDNFGHLHGDAVLKHLAESLRRAVRDQDVVARVGGDEFLVCMTCTVDPQPLVERVYGSVSRDMASMDVTVSMGVACVPGGEVGYNQLFSLADQSLYEMKRAGRNYYVMRIFDEDELADLQTVGEETGLTVSSID